MEDHFLQNTALHFYDEIPMRKLEFSSPLPRLNRIFQSQPDHFSARALTAHPTSDSSYPFPKFEEPANELTVQYDIFGKPLKDSSEFALISTDHSSNYKFDENFLSSNKSHEISVFKVGFEGGNIKEEKEDEEIKEWEIDKENTDPVGTLITPSKPKRLSVPGASRSSRRNNSGRSPLQDITPTVGVKKSPGNYLSSEIPLLLSWTPKDNKQGSNIKSFR